MPNIIGVDVDPDELDLLAQFNEANPDLFKFAARQLDTTVANLTKHEKFPILLAEADIDPRTGGAAAVVTRTARDVHGNMDDIRIQYWRMRPNGGQLLQDLIEIETSPSVEEGKTDINAVRVLGREVDPNDTGKVLLVMEAAKRINTALREGKLPQVAKIFDETYIHDVVSETLPIVGLDAQGGFNFVPSIEQGATDKEFELEVPAPIALALDGRGVNTLDYQNVMRDQRPVVATDPQTRIQFKSEVGIETNTRHHKVDASIEPLKAPEGVESRAIPDLTEEVWTRVPGDDPNQKGKRKFRLDKLSVLGEDLVNSDVVTRMRGLGIVNRIMKAMRKRRYPEVMDYLTEFDQLDLVDPLEPPPSMEEGGRLYMVSLLGNGRDEIIDDFGDQIGSTKIIVHEGLDKDGQLDRVAVGHDLGMFIPKEGSEYDGAVPDVVEWLKQVDHWFITHRHLDHAHGIGIYARKGMLEGKTFHATPDVIRAIEISLTKYDVDKKNWPTFQPITDEGHLDIEKDGVKRMTVEYSPHATPHSARTTPFRYIGRVGTNIIGSYMNPGDMRFGKYEQEGYEGPKPPASWLDREWFKRGLRGLAEREADIDAKDVDRQDTLVDFDVTSVKKRGWAVTEPEVEQNMNELLGGVFGDKGILLAMISTNDNRYETALRVATEQGRNMFEVGAAVEDTARINNILGVNYKAVEPQESGNIQLYLDHVYDTKLAALKTDLQAELEAGPAHGRKGLVQNTLEVIDWIEQRRHGYMENPSFEPGVDSPSRATLKTLVGRPSHYLYPEMRAADAQLAQKIDELGGKVDDRLPRFTATLRVSRGAKKTVAGMLEDDPSRRIIPVTGTQGSIAEMDAQLNKIAEGRSLFEADPEYRHTALPVNSDTDVIVISQSAIPGNEKNQKKLIDKLTRNRDFTVVVAMGDSFRVYNPKGEQAERLEALYGGQKGVEVQTEIDGGITVIGKGIHSSGHGNEKDIEAFANLINPDIAQPQHVTDPEAIKRTFELFDRLKLKNSGAIVENFEALGIDKGDKRENAEIESLGRLPASLVVFKLIRKFGQYFGGHLDATRFISNERRGGERRDGLMVRGGGVYEANFAEHDVEEVKRRLRDRRARQGVKRPEPGPRDRSRPIDRRRDRGTKLPPKPVPDANEQRRRANP
ncbi:MAG: hypothetical protein KI792_00220 [Alphaproteobacteria bacterium]|nr:hypothetical protein [Alphaproteobacteria bacterium SS10]